MLFTASAYDANTQHIPFIMKRLWKAIGLISIAVLGLLWLSNVSTASESASPLDRALSRPTHLQGIAQLSQGQALTQTAYLPLVCSGEPTSDNPIWVHNSEPAPHEIVLFRHTFSVEAPLSDAEIHIFADTRYEVWLDGLWVGRGPARFSQDIREYDAHQIGDLKPGEHLIAVLVQWAPNQRRSESLSPFLQAHVQGLADGQAYTAAHTGAEWLAFLSPAWRENAVPVHSWNLIGPTELLDLRQLPDDWMQPSFADEEWPTAMVKEVSNLAEQPRSIPLLDRVPITPTVLDAGVLSPGAVIGEVAASASTPYNLNFNISSSTIFTVGMLSESLGGAQLDGRQMTWEEAGSHRPDVQIASRILSPGAHTLTFADIPSTGLTFSVSTQNTDIQTESVPFQQGIHAGRRLLLAEPISSPSQVAVHSDDKVSAEFTTSPAYIVLDLGRTVHGRLTTEVTGPSGTVIDIGWDERLWEGARPLPYPGSLHKQWNQVDSWVLDGTPRSISTLDTRAGRYILIAVWGEGSVQLDNLMVYEERYPAVQRGEFASSNKTLDRIWQVGIDSLYPNLTDAYTDTPWRERGQWWGDAYVEDHINRVAFGDTDLLRRGLLFMANAFKNGKPAPLVPNGSGTLLDYGMLWVQALEDYECLTGNSDLSRDLYPELQEFLEHLGTYEHDSTGLLDIPASSRIVLIDWAAYSSSYGQSTAINSLYYGTLLDAARIAERIGDVNNASSWRQKANFIKQQVNTYLYDDSKHHYIATLSEEEGRQYRFSHTRQFGLSEASLSRADEIVNGVPSPHAQAWALAYGLVPEEEELMVTNTLLESLSSDPSTPNVEIYGMFWVLKGLGESGHIPETLKIIESYYGRLLNLGATTWWEGFNADSYYTASLSHGWGGSPTWFLTHYVLGARSTGPNTWEVEPALSGIVSASGSLPLNGGEVKVDWKRKNYENAILALSAPITTTGEIIIPFTDVTTVITMNNSVIWENESPLIDKVTKQSDGIHISVDGGDYILQAHRDAYAAYLPLVSR
jgi:alpha-L-rhamnosidase